MKKLLFVFLAVSLLAGCSSSDDDNGKITLPNESEKTQSAYADDASTGGFSFTATADWTATVTETRASNVEWLRLLNNGNETYSGGAGQHTLTIELDPNYSGQTRTASIVINCDGEKITISVTQDKATESGIVPKLISRVICHDHMNDESHNYDDIYTFDYDTRGRVKTITLKYGSISANTSWTFTYEEGAILAKDHQHNKLWEYSLNSKGYATKRTHANDKIEFTYNNKDQVTQITASEDNIWDWDRQSFHFNWNNDNMVNIDGEEFYAYGDHENIYNVDINQFITDWAGDIDEPALLLGFAGKTSKNLIKERRWIDEDPDDQASMRYVLDSNQHVTQIYGKYIDEPESLWIEIKYLD